MTNDRNPQRLFDRRDPIPFSSNFIDTPLTIFGQTVSGSYAEPLNPPNFRVISRRGNYVVWEIVLDEVRGPQNQDDNFERGYAGWSQSTADPRFRGHLINPIATTRQSQSFGGTAGNGPVVWVNTPDATVIAKGTTANRCLASAGPGLTYVTYNPGSAISSLMYGPLAGLTSYVLIGRTGATIDVHSTLGTSVGTMTGGGSSLTACWGGAVSPTDSATAGTPAWLFYANNGIWKLSIGAAITDAPTQTQFNVPDGGCVLGFDTLEKSPFGNRMYMLLPLSDRTVSCWNALATIGPTRLASVDVDGADLVEHPLPMRGIIYGRLWQRRAVVSDGFRVIQFDGEEAKDLSIFAKVYLASSSYSIRVVGLGGDDSSLRALVQIGDNGGAANFTLQEWEYNEDTRGWSPVTKQSVPITVDSNAGIGGAPFDPAYQSVYHGPNLPYSRIHATSYVAMNNGSEVTWEYRKVWPRGSNPNFHFQSFETSSVHTWPQWRLPGDLAGPPFVIAQVDGRMLDLEDGGTGATALVEIAKQSSATSSALSFTSTPISRSFKQAEELRGRVYEPQEVYALHALQVRETLTAGSGATKSPDGLPLKIKGVSFLDGNVRSPAGLFE